MIAETKQWIADLIRNEYDKAPDLGDANYPAFEKEWDDGADCIAEQIIERFYLHRPAPSPSVPDEREKLVSRLVSAMDQLLDDMADGHCVCEQAKQEAIAAVAALRAPAPRRCDMAHDTALTPDDQR